MADEAQRENRGTDRSSIDRSGHDGPGDRLRAGALPASDSSAHRRRSRSGRARGDAASDARGGARERRADRWTSGRAAARHRPGHLPRGGALPGAAQARRPASAPGRAERGRRARPTSTRACSPPPRRCSARSSRPRRSTTRCSARARAADRARSDDAQRGSASIRRAVAGAVPAAQGDRPGAVGLGHRDLPQLPAEVQVRARPADPHRADASPALRDRRPPGARALPLRGRTDARADAATCSTPAGAGAASANASASSGCARRRAWRSPAITSGCTARTPSRCGSSARSPSGSDPTICAGASTASIVSATASERGVRADRLQDLAPQDGRAAEGRRPAVPVRARRARSLGAGVLAPGLLLRARRPQGPGSQRRERAPSRSRTRCSRSARASSPRSSSRPPRTRPARSATTASSARRPRGSALAAPRAPAGAESAGIRGRGCLRRERPRGALSSSLSAACSSRSTNAWMSGSLCTASPTWRS